MDEPAPLSCGVIVLAAGASRRMGRPKQLLPIGGVPLVRRIVEEVLKTSCAPVIVVLGAHADEVAAALDGLAVHRLVNAEWAEGMGSSLRAGVAEILKLDPRLAELIVVLGDQPNLTADHLRRLGEVHRRTGYAVVATESREVRMPPALFAAEYFPRLLALRGDAGARGLLRFPGALLAAVPVGELVDLDTPDDYAEFLRRQLGRAAPE